MWKHLYVMDRIQLTEMTENNLVNWIHHAVESNIIILEGKAWVDGGRSVGETQSEKEGEGESESEKRGWRNRRVGTKEGEDRAHFFVALSNGTSSISPKRSLQSTKLLISNERPWNTVAKQLREGAYRAADSFPLGVHHYNFFQPHRLSCWWRAACTQWPRTRKWAPPAKLQITPVHTNLVSARRAGLHLRVCLQRAPGWERKTHRHKLIP